MLAWLTLTHRKIIDVLSLDLKKIDKNERSISATNKAIATNEKSIRDIRQSVSEIYSKAKMYESIQPDPVIEYFLSAIGGRYKESLSRGELYARFRAEYAKEMPEKEANLLFNRKLNFAVTRKILDLHKIEAEMPYYRIDNFGYEYMRILEEKKKQTD